MHFDAYVMVDWSANSGPKRGKDSIWWCMAGWQGARLRVGPPVNAATRPGAMAAIRARLAALRPARKGANLVGQASA